MSSLLPVSLLRLCPVCRYLILILICSGRSLPVYTSVSGLRGFGRFMAFLGLCADSSLPCYLYTICPCTFLIPPFNGVHSLSVLSVIDVLTLNRPFLVTENCTL